jgi:hypothetical protein
MKKTTIALLIVAASGATLAKLPALNDEAKAKAAEAAAKTAWSGKVDGYLLCKSQDRAAASYFKTTKAAGKDAKPAVATPACADPGAFVYPPVQAAAPVAAPAPAATVVPAKKS